MALIVGPNTYQNAQTFNSGVRYSTSTKAVNYVTTGGDFTLAVDTTAAPVLITLPAALTVSGQLFNIKKVDASGNAVTLSGNGAETIDGLATQSTTTQWFNFQIQSTGSAWFIL